MSTSTTSAMSKYTEHITNAYTSLFDHPDFLCKDEISSPAETVHKRCARAY